MKSRVVISFLCIFALVQMAFFPKQYIPAFQQGLNLFATKLLPTLLPFFFLCGILVRSGVVEIFAEFAFAKTAKKMGLSAHFPYVFALSLMSGYPMNAKITKDIFDCGEISPQEAESLAFSTSTSGVLFVCGTVGTLMLSSLRLGVFLMLLHIFSCLVGYYIFAKINGKPKFSSQKTRIKKENPSIFLAISESGISAISSILSVFLYVSVFAVLSQMLQNFGVISMLAKPAIIFGLNPKLLEGFFLGMCEITLGCETLAKLPSQTSLVLIASMISFGGISINLQALNFLLPCKVNPARFMVLKLTQMLITAVIGGVALLVVFCLNF